MRAKKTLFFFKQLCYIINEKFIAKPINRLYKFTAKLMD